LANLGIVNSIEKRIKVVDSDSGILDLLKQKGTFVGFFYKPYLQGHALTVGYSL
jgi:hypothetical protein